MIKTILLLVAVAILAVCVFATTRPDTFSVTRTVDIDAPAERVFTFLDDFHQWGAWSPWEKLDPGMQRTFRGPQSGAGAIYEWTGNSKVGSGRMEILESHGPGDLRIKLDFLKPFEAHNSTEFTLQPENGRTHVVWMMRGPMPYVSKVISVFVSMDGMIGDDFQRGLANLKTAAESHRS